MDRILALKQQGKSLRKIARELGIPHTTVQYKLRKLTATVQSEPVQSLQDHIVQPEPVNQEDVQTVQGVQVETVQGVQDFAVPVQSVQHPTPKLEVVYKKEDPEVQPYLHLFPEDVETFSFHVLGSPPLGVRNFRKVIAQKGIDSTRWEDVYFVPKGYIWPSGTKPEMFIKGNLTSWDDRDKEIWALYQEGKNQREIAKSLGWKCEVIYKRLRRLIEETATNQ